MKSKDFLDQYSTVLLKNPSPNLKGFGFDLRPTKNTFVIFCEDREKDLIQGITHELTEATLYHLSSEFSQWSIIKLHERHAGLLLHFVTFLSLPIYSKILDVVNFWLAIIETFEGKWNEKRSKR